MKNTPEDARHDTRRIKVDPRAVVVFGHCAASRLHDPAAAIFADPRDIRTAGELDRIDTRCASCDSRTMVSHDPGAVLVITGHADGCTWWVPRLTDAMRREGDGIAAFEASLAGEDGDVA